MGLVIIFLALYVSIVESTYQRVTETRRCEDIWIPLCKQLPYNSTMFPNAAEHLSQENARKVVIDQYRDLVTINCSKYAAFFLCSYYLPICALEFSQPIRPCREVCEQVKRDCLPTIKRYKRRWPDHVRCEDLPLYDTDVCVKPESFVSSVSCQCTKSRLNFHLYQENAYSFALKVRIQSVSNRGGERVITATVQRVIQEGLIRLRRGDTIQLYSMTNCNCPEVDVTIPEVLVAGHEDVSQNKLILSPETGLVETWERAWVEKFKKWERRLSRRLTRKNSERAGKNRRRL